MSKRGNTLSYILYSDLVWWMQLILKNSCCVGEILNLKCVLIEFAIPNLSLIYFCTSEVFKTSVLKKILQITFWICVSVVNSQRLFCIRELILKANIKAFWQIVLRHTLMDLFNSGQINEKFARYFQLWSFWWPSCWSTVWYS